MDETLKNYNILNTRPTHQTKNLDQLIYSLGANPIYFPTLLINPINTSSNVSLCKQLNNVDFAIFVSANAAHCSFPSWPKPLNNIKAITTGPGTARALEAYGIQQIEIPKSFSSEGILKLPMLNDIQGKKILIFTGTHSRPLLKKTLSERGAHVLVCECYERECPTPSPSQINNLTQQKLNGIISTSLESLKNLEKLVDQFDLDLKGCPIIVISTKMQYHAEKTGWERIIVSENASDLAISKSLFELKPV